MLVEAVKRLLKAEAGVISLEKKHQREKQIFIFRTN